MTKEELIEDTQSFLTSSYSIPLRIPPKEIERKIKDAERWFYLNYDNAVESRYYIVPHDYFGTTEFRERREVPLPECVMSVAECRESRGAGRIGIGDKDFSVSRLIASDVFLGSFSSDDLVSRVTYASYYDLSKAFMKDWIRYKFNYSTHKLILEGEVPDADLFLRTYVKVDTNKLYDDYYFIEYVRGQALLSIGRMTNIITMNLPGGASLNTMELKSEGQEMIQRVKEEIEALQPSNYFATFN